VTAADCVECWDLVLEMLLLLGLHYTYQHSIFPKYLSISGAMIGPSCTGCVIIATWNMLSPVNLIMSRWDWRKLHSWHYIRPFNYCGHVQQPLSFQLNYDCSRVRICSVVIDSEWGHIDLRAIFGWAIRPFLHSQAFIKSYRITGSSCKSWMLP
jgi:hypothetical protein